MREGLEKKVKYALMFGLVSLCSTIAGLKVKDYYNRRSHYEGNEEVRGEEYTRREAELFIQQHEPLLLTILYYPEVKASKDYLKNSSEETSNF